MPFEEIRHIHLGVTESHTHVYLGETSASLAKWMYDRLDIPIQIEKTDIIATIEEFTYLHNVKATMFTNTDHVARDIKVLLDAYDVLHTNSFRLPEPRSSQFFMKESFLTADVVSVFYNHTKNMTIVIPGDISIDVSDPIFTLTRDFQWVDQIRLYPNNKTNFVAALTEALDKKSCEDFADAKKRMAVFKLDVPR